MDLWKKSLYAMTMAILKHGERKMSDKKLSMLWKFDKPIQSIW